MRTLIWLFIAAAGQAAALTIIDAGRALHYQHYLPLDRIWISHPLAASVILAQLAIVAYAAALRVRRIGRPNWKWIASAAALALASTVPSRVMPAYATELVLATAIELLNVATLVFLAISIPQHWIAWWTPRAHRLLSPAVCAAWVVLLSAGLNLVCYERHPHVADEVTYLYQARYMSEGKVYLATPEIPEAFDLDLMMIDKNRWYSPVSPGWPAILSAGVWLGVPWLVNPLLAGINVLLAYRFLANLYGARAARIGAALLAISPWNIFMAMSFMTHTATLTVALAAGVAFQTAVRTRRAAWSFAAGAAIGAATLIRPLDAAVLIAVAGGWYLVTRALTLRLAVAAAAGAILLAAVNLPYNRAVTGDWLRAPMTAYTDKYYGPKKNALGFGPERGLGWPLDPFPGHAPKDAAVNALLNTASINTELFGWSTGSLLLIAFAVFARPFTRSDALMIAIVAAVVGAYSLYWFSGGPDFGARYWYLLLIPCVALTVRGLEALKTSHAMPAVFCLSLLSLTLFIPWRAMDKYRDYLNMSPGVLHLARAGALDGGLVLIEGQRFPDYESAAIYNPLDLHDSGTVYAWDRDPAARAKVMEAYRDRPVWLVQGPTITGGSYQVVKQLSAPSRAAR